MATTVVAAAVTTTVYVDDTPSPVDSLLVVPQPINPGQVIAAGLDAAPQTTSTTVPVTVVASGTATLPASGGWSPLTLTVGLGLASAGALLTRRNPKEDR